MMQFPPYTSSLLSSTSRHVNNIHNPIQIEDDEPAKQCQTSQCNGKGEKKIKTKRNEVMLLCDKCSKLYQRGNYCDFCEQVYSNGSYDQDETGWIQCDGCEKWNHINCEAKHRNINIRNEIDNITYYCVSCLKPKNKRPSAQKEEPPVQKEYKVRIPLETEPTDGRNREKNITFVATKDNKVQYTFRFNLYEEDIKSDLEALKSNLSIIKKIKKQPSPIQSVQESDPQQQGKSRLRTRKQKFKVNYRDLGGDY
ncbi:hypothetical protein pb186bvf_001270 [Paramecium bursaria]